MPGCGLLRRGAQVISDRCCIVRPDPIIPRVVEYPGVRVKILRISYSDPVQLWMGTEFKSVPGYVPLDSWGWSKFPNSGIAGGDQSAP